MLGFSGRHSVGGEGQSIARMSRLLQRNRAERTPPQSTNGPTRHSPQAHSLQHHLQPPSRCEDSGWQACVPPPQKARYCAQMR